jgi:hypothetical protein
MEENSDGGFFVERCSLGGDQKFNFSALAISVVQRPTLKRSTMHTLASQSIKSLPVISGGVS